MYNLVVFASGNGTTLQAIIDAISLGKLKSKIVLVVSNKEDAYALKRAKEANIEIYVISSKGVNETDKELCDKLSEYRVDLIVLAGYLKMIGPRIISKYKIINTHPSLLPKFGGKGMHGMNVHKAVIEAKEKVSGVTVHFVNNEYDKGSIIAQRKVDVADTDTPDTLSAKVQAVEKEQLVEVISKFEKGEI